jgi:CobQ-like glutamine amidotransferase family enzyme
VSTILQFFPERLDVNGDAQNALVLTRRARWAGMDVELVPISPGDRVPHERPAAVVIGSSVDAELVALRADLADFAVALNDWVGAGVPLLAIGTGFELLSHGIQFGSPEEPGELLEGLGIFPGRARPLATRASDDLVVDAREGRLLGFENHARGFLVPADAPAFGTVVRGTGNDGRSEGSRIASAIGTHLHGPVLAKNPVLADAMLTAAFGEAYRADSPEALRVDGYAAAARAAILAKLDMAVRP